MPRAKKADTGIKYPYIEVTKLVHNGVVHTHRQRIYSEKTERKGYRILLEKISQVSSLIYYSSLTHMLKDQGKGS